MVRKVNSSMRFKEFLKEYKDISQAQKKIIQQIADLDPTDELGAKLLDNIFRVLNSEKTGGNITKAFGPPMADEKMDDATKQKHITNVAKIISGVDSDFASMNRFLKRLKSGKAISISALSKPVSTFNQICNGDAVAINVLNALMTYGVGSKRKGPGEFALAMMSPSIRLADGQGDIEIEGLGKVELKSETAKGGGRLGMGGPTRDSQMQVIEKYKESAPQLAQRLSTIKSISMNPYMKLLNETLPIGNAQNKKLRIDITRDILALTFGDFASKMAEGYGQADPKIALANFVKINFEWYKAKDNFDAFMIMNFPLQKTMVARSGDDLIGLNSAGHLKFGAPSFIHTGQSSEVYTQMATSNAKV